MHALLSGALLAGYAYAHVVTSRLRPRAQIPVHLLVILLPLAVLPIRIAATWRPPAEHNPIPWLVLLMLVCMGLPFFVVSTSASMMQKWFSLSSHKSARDPYFLYAASNAGSIVGLIGYILVLEPNLTLAQQSHVWSVGYGILILLTTSCALLLAKQSTGARKPAESSDLPADDGPASIPLARKLRWVALAFAPSSLMLGLTTFLTTNIAAVPLLWVIPLTIYLLTFAFAFSRRPLCPALADGALAAADRAACPGRAGQGAAALAGSHMPDPHLDVLRGGDGLPRSTGARPARIRGT